MLAGFAGYAILAEEQHQHTAQAVEKGFITSLRILENSHGLSWDCGKMVNLNSARFAATKIILKRRNSVRFAETLLLTNVKIQFKQMGILFAAGWKSFAAHIVVGLEISTAEHAECLPLSEENTGPGKTCGFRHSPVIGAESWEPIILKSYRRTKADCWNARYAEAVKPCGMDDIVQSVNNRCRMYVFTMAKAPIPAEQMTVTVVFVENRRFSISQGGSLNTLIPMNFQNYVKQKNIVPKDKLPG